MEVTLQSFKKRFTYDPAKDLLGKGGFGEVYKAYDTEDQIFVALKISYAATDDKHSLINEIKRFKKLKHPNIVQHIEAYEVNTGGTDIHGRPIISHVGILEYADSGTLADLLKKGKPDNRITEELARDIIDGLAYLHGEGIIHRDLKPTNILLFSEGEKLHAKITDFGIAKRSDATAASTQLVGTVEYMAPEYFTTGNVSTASDVWSVGVLLLEALTGVHPFGKTTQGLGNEQIINNILNRELGSVAAQVRSPYKELITRCLMREAALRPQSAEGLKGLLQEGAEEFGERTQVIGFRKPIAETKSSESKWKSWGKSLFDFDVSNGKWRKVIAREFIALLVIVSSLTIVFIWQNVDKQVIQYRTRKLNSVVEINQKFIDSVTLICYNKIHQKETFLDCVFFGDREFEASKLYIPARTKIVGYGERKVEICKGDLYPEVYLYDTPSLHTPLLLCLSDKERKYKKFVYPKDVIDETMRGEVITSDLLFVGIAKRLDDKNWVNWFLNIRSVKLPKLKRYFELNEVTDPIKFKNLFVDYILLTKEEYQTAFKIDSVKNQISLASKKMKEINYSTFNTSDFANPLYFGLLVFFVLFYPFRLFLITVLLAVRTLRTN